LGIVAEILMIVLALKAAPAGVRKPSCADALADGETRHASADSIDAADDFVPGDERINDSLEFAVNDMKIGAANAARADADADLTLARFEIAECDALKRSAFADLLHGVGGEACHSPFAL
jgi:hypothetical protein